eukprot:4414105-Lingulodinium_polyedra.AAC.1
MARKDSQCRRSQPAAGTYSTPTPPAPPRRAWPAAPPRRAWLSGPGSPNRAFPRASAQHAANRPPRQSGQ